MDNTFFPECIDIIEEMKIVYRHDSRPWMIGFSGGKDSTLLCCLVFEMLKQLKPDELTKKIYIVSSDTMVENPRVASYMHDMSKRIGVEGKKYGVISKILVPDIDKTFWSCVIGLGYPTPEPPNFRWCTDKMKIMPMNKFVLDTIASDGEVIMLLGVRKAESSYRARGIKAREIDGKILCPHPTVKNAYVYNPLTEIPNERIWEYLLSGDGKTPWKSDNKDLFSLYQGETVGEEQSTLGEVDKDKIPITGNSRFGCWICTMVKNDKSLSRFIDNGDESLIPLAEFRNWLMERRRDPEYRSRRRRNGAVYEKDGELGFGAFSMEGRQKILRKLLELEVQTGFNLVTQDELRTIDRMWEKEGDIYRRTLVDIYYEIKGERLPWDEYRLPLFDEETFTILKQACSEFEVDYEMMSKLISSVEENKHYTKGNKLNKDFEKIVNEGWLHYENIKQAKEAIDNED